jgi:hypothetical protein
MAQNCVGDGVGDGVGDWRLELGDGVPFSDLESLFSGFTTYHTGI